MLGIDFEADQPGANPRPIFWEKIAKKDMENKTMENIITMMKESITHEFREMGKVKSPKNGSIALVDRVPEFRGLIRSHAPPKF